MVSDTEYLFIQKLEQEKRRRQEEEDVPFREYDRVDADHNGLSDDFERDVGIIEDDEENHAMGAKFLQSRGKAIVSRKGMIQFPYDNSKISLQVRKPKGYGKSRSGGMRTTIPDIKTMPLSVEMRSGNDHNHHLHKIPTANIRQPELYRMDSGKIKGVNVKGTMQKMEESASHVNKRQSDFSKKYAGKTTIKKTSEKQTDDLSAHIINFAKKNSKKSKLNLSFGSLDFSIVGIGTKKRKAGVI